MVVGGGIAGSATAAALAEAEPAVEVVLLDAWPHRPFDRPPLSKKVLVDGLGEDGCSLKPEGWWAEHGVDLRTSTRVLDIDVDAHTLALDDGSSQAWSSLVLATGGRPRGLPVEGADLPGVCSVNDLDGALACADQLASAEQVVVIGAGFVGCEAAAAIRRAGRSVTVLEAGPRPLEHAVGAQVADWLLGLHRAEGVDIRVGTGVTAIDGDDHVRSVSTADGTQHRADLVIVAIGIELTLDLAVAAGCAVADGVTVDDRLRTSVPGVLAVGDIARFPSRFAGLDEDGAPLSYRCEHYNVAVGHGAAAARTILGQDGPYDDLPSWWSDQYDLVLDGIGLTEGADAIAVDGNLDDHDFLVTYSRAGKPVGGLACGHRRALHGLRGQLQARVTFTG